jgi:hypothetical protein
MALYKIQGVDVSGDFPNSSAHSDIPRDNAGDKFIDSVDVDNESSVKDQCFIIRKDKTSTEPPMLQRGVLNALLISSKLHCFYVNESSLVRPHTVLTSHGQELIFYNCVVTKHKALNIVYSLQYCVADGQASNERNLILLGVCANKRNPFAYQGYIYNMDKNIVVRVSPNKVSDNL